VWPTGRHLEPSAGTQRKNAGAPSASRQGKVQTEGNRPDRKTLTCAEGPYTIGMWEETKPVEIALVEVKSMLHFTRNIPNYGLTIKHFTLTRVK
jgi:hypothetical protein